jgi:hypothetical protein
VRQTAEPAGRIRPEWAAQVLGISESTAKRWWVFAKAWLYREITA